MDILNLARKAKEAENNLRKYSSLAKTAAIVAIAKNIKNQKEKILSANQLDVKIATDEKLSPVIIDRLILNEKKIESMINSALEISQQEDPAYKIIETYQRPNGLIVHKQLVPIGVVAMIFESRPNVVIDAACLAIRSSNVLILKGGKEAHHSNNQLAQIVTETIENHLCPNVISLITDKEDVVKLIKLNQYIDLIIPRGGEQLVNFITQNSTIPVIAHNKGLCHTYIHHDADFELASRVSLNAKVQRPGVCNAMETLLINVKWKEEFVKKLLEEFIKNGVSIRGCPATLKYNSAIIPANEIDWATEYLDKILSIKIVTSEEEAISHIQKYGSKHTEAIIAKDESVISQFQQNIDASCIIINSSTRFNDGGELGLGAELGISTNKLHAYGPMGARELTIPRFVVHGQGQIRE